MYEHKSYSVVQQIPLPIADGDAQHGRMLPADGHIHSQWSWDALSGSMERSCARAAALGLRSIAFTEHVDFTMWTIPPEAVAAMPPEFRTMIRPRGLPKSV